MFSDECYAEFTWDGRPRTILEHGLDGVVAVHSLSKRSNLAGLRVGFYAGDHELRAVPEGGAQARRHAGARTGPGGRRRRAAPTTSTSPSSATATVPRLEAMARVLRGWAGLDVALPEGGFYLWIEVGDAWSFTEKLAAEGGALVSPGEFYGPAGASHIRVAVVQPDDRLALVAERLGVAP